MSTFSTGAIASIKIEGSFLTTVQKWNITETTSSPNTVVASNSKQGTLSSDGVKSFSGGFDYCGLSCPFVPGKKYAFVGYTGPTSTENNAGKLKSCDIIITGMSTTIDWKTNAPITWAVTFQGTGEITTSAGTQIDTTTPDIVCPQGATVVVKKQSETTTENVTTSGWELNTITFSITAAISGGVATSNSDGWSVYTGGALNYSAGFTFTNDDFGSLGLSVGDQLSTAITFADERTLEFKWTRLNEVGDVTFDNASAESITQQVNGVMNAYNAAGYGEIKIGSSTVWPPTLT